MSGLEFRMLGPLEVRANGALLDLRATSARRLLARLLLDPNRAVPSDRLVEDLFGERPPATALNSLFNSISQIRTVLGGDVLATGPAGFELRVDWTRTDIYRFERLAAAGQARLTAGDAGGAAETLRLALCLWRGYPFEQFGSEAWAVKEVIRLERLRLNTIEDRIDAGFALGQEAQLIPQLEVLVAMEPLRERPRGQLMLAFYNVGRHADALIAYQDARCFFADEGLDFSPQLHELYVNVLSQLAVPGARALSSIPDAKVKTKPIVARPSSVPSAASRQTQTRTTEALARLFDDWAFRLCRGEWPDPRDYLERAGNNADDLRLLMDTYIRALPRPAPAHADVERARAWLAATPPTEL